jgi:DNA-directed RNA polymerase specialized sigma24 family protein
MHWPEISDRQLVELCLEGDRDAWGEFLRRFHRLVAGVAAKTLPLRLRNPDTVKDIVQDSWKRIFMRNFNALHSLEWRHERALQGLLKVTASSVAKDHIRAIKSQKRDIDKEDSLDSQVRASTREDVQNKVDYKILLDQLARCLGKRIHDEPNRTRDIAMFLLFYSHRVTASDLARVYQLGVRFVENTVARLARIAREHCL